MIQDRRYLGLALLASLGVNLFLVGILAGDWVRGRALATREPPAATTDARGGDTIARGAVQRLLAAVPEAQRPEVERRLGAHRRDIQRANQQLREARERVQRVASADTLDRAELERAYAEQRERAAAVQKAIQVAAIDAIADLPPETRRAIVAAVLGSGAAPGARR